MSDAVEAVKNNPGVTALTTLILLFGGTTYVSEDAENDDINEMHLEFTAADNIQDARTEELDDLYHELDKRLALIERDHERENP